MVEINASALRKYMLERKELQCQNESIKKTTWFSRWSLSWRYEGCGKIILQTEVSFSPPEDEKGEFGGARAERVLEGVLHQTDGVSVTPP